MEVSFCEGSESWTNPELLESLRAALESRDTSHHWYVARWTPGAPASGGLKVYLTSSDRESNPKFFTSLLGEVHKKLANGLALAAGERGWPAPRFSVNSAPHDSDENWTYFFEVGPYRTEPVVIHPNKVLAVGEEEALSPLLGLECQDPVFGLPAKWVTFSQSERAAQNGSLLFEAAEVVMGHAINFIQSRMEHAVGLWEVNSWLSRSLPLENGRADKAMDRLPLTLILLRKLMAEGLHLPEPARFSEQIQLALTAAPNSDPHELGILVRKEVVNDNVPRWLDEHGFLNALEWKGPENGALKPEDHHRMLARLSVTLEDALQRVEGGTPVLITDIEEREELANSLHGLFPDLPVLAWSDLKDASNVHILASINAKLKVDPSMMPAAYFSIS